MTDQIFKLPIELVPKTCSGLNPLIKMTRAQWEKFRADMIAVQGGVCSVCDGVSRLSCHEVWNYDDERHIQLLKGFRTVCGMCHQVIHFGRSAILASKGQLDLEAVIAHFLKVNGVGRSEFELHKRSAFAQWRERSKHQWQIDLGEWTSQALPWTAGRTGSEL